MKVILPPNVWWPLRLDIPPGGVVPFAVWMYWTFQFLRPTEVA